MIFCYGHFQRMGRGGYKPGNEAITREVKRGAKTSTREQRVLIYDNLRMMVQLVKSNALHGRALTFILHRIGG